MHTDMFCASTQNINSTIIIIISGNHPYVRYYKEYLSQFIGSLLKFQANFKILDGILF